MGKKIFTIGYEHKKINDLIYLLKNNGVKVLIDVRNYPNSRINGFSKNSLKESLCKADIKYCSWPELGSPKQIRDFARKENDYEKALKLYKKYLDKMDNDIIQLGLIISTTTTCLMCYEDNPLYCHRSILADKLASNLGLKVDHIGNGKLENHRNANHR